MKPAAVRIEVIKGDETHKKPWKRVVRVIARDRSMSIDSQEFETREEHQASLAQSLASWRADRFRPAG